ncbi:hypothetical protein LR090_02075 [Candidatus Bipolaricaulota bacterium]|nr:hypothetical protein [Candidatus Bipolaricaulota bacterium]
MKQPHNNEIRGIRQKVQIAISDGISFLLRRTRELALPNLTWILTLLIVYAIPVWGASVQPTLWSTTGNVSCDDVCSGCWTELKIDPPQEGTFTDGTLTVQIYGAQYEGNEMKSFNWTSNIPVSVVIVKAQYTLCMITAPTKAQVISI